MGQKRAFIKAIASYLPAGKLTNEDLAAEFSDWDPDKIFQKTGIASRGVSGPDECASDLGIAAARRLFEQGECSPDEVDFLIFCTQSPDHFLPTTACIMQDRLGLRLDSGAIDFNQGCSGFVYGLALAGSLIEANSAKNVLLITADTYTKFINPRDRSVRTLFGDGAAATLVSSRESEEPAIGPFVFGTDGRGMNNLIVPAGGLRLRPGAETAVEREDEQGNRRSQADLYMNGPEIFNFTLQTVPLALEQLLQKTGLGIGDIDYFILHQANKFMLERLRAKMKIPPDKFCIDMEMSGNTVSSTIPIAFERAKMQGRVRKGDKLALIGFGVGYSWAACIIETA